MLHIAIIGTGNLGGRHLQSLASLKETAVIQVVDISASASEQAANWFHEKEPGQHLKLEIHQDISDLHEHIDIAIVATSADSRRRLTERLLTEKEVDYLILEKVLFQREADYRAVAEFIREKGCKAWVNCPRRTVDFYRECAELIKNEAFFQFAVSGADWGMGCNAVHYLDLIAFLTGSPEGFIISTEGLDRTVRDSKRQGFLEFTGVLEGRSGRCSHFTLASMARSDAPVLITMRSPNLFCMIRESDKKVWMMSGKNGWNAEEFTMARRYQSQMTSLVVGEILKTGNCGLTAYEDSMKIHVPFIRSLLEFLRVHMEWEKDTCPIT